MKIEGNRPNQETTAASRAEPARADRSGRADRGGDVSADRVQLSEDAQLVMSALRAAESVPTIRPDVVERMRQKLAAGQIGNDSTRLADRLIDHLLGN